MTHIRLGNGLFEVVAILGWLYNAAIPRPERTIRSGVMAKAILEAEIRVVGEKKCMYEPA